MSCVTCDGPGALPHTHSLSPDNSTRYRTDDNAHISARFGDVIAPGAMAVLLQGRDVTAQCVEVLAGPQGVGWVEMRLMPNEGNYVLHPARFECAGCGAPSDYSAWPTEPDETNTTCDACPNCYTADPPRQVHPTHCQTVIRQGAVIILRDTTITAAPARDPRQDVTASGGPGTGLGDDQVRQQIATMAASGVKFPEPAEPAPVESAGPPLVDEWDDISDHVVGDLVFPGRAVTQRMVCPQCGNGRGREGPVTCSRCGTLRPPVPDNVIHHEMTPAQQEAIDRDPAGSLMALGALYVTDDHAGQARISGVMHPDDAEAVSELARQLMANRTSGEG